MTSCWARARVIWQAAPTWLTGAAVAITVTNEEIASLLPAGAATTAGRWALLATGWLGAAVAIIRRVTPVPADQRGLLAPPAPR